MDLQPWVEKIRRADPRALARALSEIENRGPQAQPLLRALFPYSGKARRIGITGAPGAGKSTLVNRLAARLRKQDHSVAIIGVDPTSPYSRGAILGDRVRMQSHHADPGVFIRSMATRGVLGGLAPATADAITALEASGRDVIIVETVGVGQAEVDVVKLASAVVLVLTPSMGDDVQTLKAGIIEIADLFVINKADQPGADRIESQLEALLSLAPASAKKPSVLRTIATDDVGIDELADILQSLPAETERLVAGWKERLAAMLRQRLLEQVLKDGVPEDELATAAREIAQRKRNPYEFIEEVLQRAGVQ